AGEPLALMALPDTDLLELTLPVDAPHADRPAAELCADLPANVVLVAIVRRGHVRAPHPETVLAAGDDLIFLSSSEDTDALAQLLGPG
ncbi:TrkA C-terminal domain-containing protein, partial [Marinitenerispora sediminis]